MATTYTNLFPMINNFEALHAAWLRVIAGRRLQSDVLRFEQSLESHLIDIEDALTHRTYRTGPYRSFKVYDPKERDVAALPLRDRVVQHALVAVVEPIWEARYIHDSYACRPGRGTHAGADRAQDFLRRTLRQRGRVYALKADVSKYFASIRHDVLKQLLRRRIGCPDTLWLLDEIIDSTADPAGILPRGIPIGNLTSQMFANLYLHELDIYVKQTLRERLYVRYMDDFAIIGPDKEHLHALRRNIEAWLWAQLGLRLNRKTQVFPVADETGNAHALDFLGYRIWPSHRRLRKDSAGRMRRKLKRMARQYREGNIGWEKVQAVTASWVGHARHADTWRLRTSVLRSVSFSPPRSQIGVHFSEETLR